MSGHKDDRNYIVTQNWLGNWQSSCDRCGEASKDGSLAMVFAHLWRHKSCDGTPVKEKP